MSPLSEAICKRVSEKRGLSYAIGLILGLIAWVPFLNIGDLTQLWNSETSLMLLTISGAVAKFLSGFGIMLTYAAFCSLVLRIVSPSMKGKKQRLKTMKILLLLPVLGIVAYAVYLIWHALIDLQALSFIESLTATYGIWSLLLAVYVVPALRGSYRPELQKGSLDKARETLSEGKHRLWRGYQFYIHRDYGKVYASEFERYQTRLNSLRSILGAVLLLPLAVTLFVVPPVAGVTLVLWIRILSAEYRPLTLAERGLLVLIALGILALATYLFLTAIVFTSLLYINVSYALGILLSIGTLGNLLSRL